MECMQVIVKTNYDGKEAAEVIENVVLMSSIDDVVSVTFTAEDGRKMTGYIRLDGYTELIVR